MSRSIRSRTAYYRKHTRRGPPPFPKVLPPHLVALAQEPLPNSELFRAVCRSADEYDESGLEQWDRNPPYSESKDPDPTDSPAERAWTLKLVDVVNGRRTREFAEFTQSLADKYKDQPVVNYQRELQEDLIDGLGCYKDLEEVVRGYDGGAREVTMARNRLQWWARRLYWVYMEIERVKES